ncbi:MAG: cyclic nucleotide-binding domain-containing protein [Zavarzinia sp.]|nr:cyclic nucleotide-binding domain-containing protein [Zavarzinia sp.]
MRKVLFLFSALTDGDVDWLVDNGRVRRVAGASPLLTEGQAASHLFIILEGRVAITSRRLGDLGVNGPGEILGEIGFVTDGPSTATVRPSPMVTVLEVPRERIAAKLATDGAFAGRFYRAIARFLAHRLRYTVQADPTDQMEPDGTDNRIAPEFLDTLDVAGQRFAWLCRRCLDNGTGHAGTTVPSPLDDDWAEGTP